MTRATLKVMRGTGRAWMMAATVVGLAAAACSDGGGPSALERARAEMASSTTAPVTVPRTTVPTTSTSTTTVARTTTPTTAPAGLGTGSRGAEVAALEKRLVAMHYYVGVDDDVYDQNTAYAVTAFQKVQRMARTGRATDDVVAAVAAAQAPPPLVPGGGDDRVEIDIPRQVLFLYKGGALDKILTVSSGSNQRFCSEGWCRKAVTPGGSFGIYRQARGWETGPLGSLYNPLYFNGGIAIHGSRSVPPHPASHGCVRISMAAAEWFPGEVHNGMPVHVYGVEGQPPTPGATPGSPSTTTPTDGGPAPSTTATTTAPDATTPTTAPGLLGGLFRPPG